MAGNALTSNPVDSCIEAHKTHWLAMRQLLTCQDLATKARAQTIGAAATFAHEYREEAALKLVANHEPLLRDVTNAAPHTQTNLKRAGAYDAVFVDKMLLETTRRLLGCTDATRAQFDALAQPLDPLAMGMQKAWGVTAQYLDQRIQSSVAQKPGRAPDLSDEAAKAMKAVMFELAQPAYPVGPSY